MTTVAGTVLYSGFRGARVFALTSDGYPAGTNATAYEGIDVGGNRNLAIQRAEPRKISHPGKDTVLAVDYLPPLEGDTLELRIQNSHHSLIALMKGQTIPTAFIDASEIAWATDRDGFEAQVGLMAWQQALDLDPGLRRYRTFIYPAVKSIPVPAGMGDAVEESRFMMAPTPVARRLWGAAPALGTEGYTRAGYYEYISTDPLWIAAYKGTGAAVDFNFSAGYPAVSTSVIAVFKNGTEVTTGITKTTTKVTFDVAPLVTDQLVVVYQTPD